MAQPRNPWEGLSKAEHARRVKKMRATRLANLKPGQSMNGKGVRGVVPEIRRPAAITERAVSGAAEPDIALLARLIVAVFKEMQT